MKFRKRYFLFGALLALFGTVGLLLYRPRYIRQFVSAAQIGDAQFYFETDQKIIALTIDDGPHHAITPQVLDVLEAHEVPATFFLLADHVETHEEIIERIVADGHEIGNHMLDDNRSILLDVDEFERQITQADIVLRKYQPALSWYRPGSGLYNQRMLTRATTLGYQTVLGSIYPYDANIPNRFNGVDFIVSYVVKNSHPGAIVVLHDGRDERARLIDVLNQLIPALKEEGYRFMTLSQMKGEGE